MTHYGRPLNARNLFRSYRLLGATVNINSIMRLEDSNLLVTYTVDIPAKP